MKKLYLAVLNVIVVPTLWANTPSPSDAVTQLLNKIQNNTATTAEATGSTLQKSLQTLIRNDTDYQQQNQKQRETYINATQQYNQFAANLSSALASVQQKNNSAYTNALSYQFNDLDKQYLCSQNTTNTDNECSPKGQLSSTDGMNLFSPTLYTDPAKPLNMLNNFYTQAFYLYAKQEPMATSLAGSIFNSYYSQRVPTNNKDSSTFMSQLKDLVSLPMTANWQTTLNNATQSDRIRTLISLVAVSNYLHYLTLQNNQKRNVLLAAAIFQRTKANNNQRQEIVLLSNLVNEMKQHNK